MDEHELTMLQDSFREVLQSECQPERVLRHADGEDLREPLWQTMVNLGWPALVAAEKDGGLGLGADALTLLYKELGSALAPTALMPTLLVSEILSTFGSDAQRVAWLEGIITGERRAALMQPGAAPVPMVRSSCGVVLAGVAEQLLEVEGADIVLVLARTAEGETARVLVDLGSDGVTVEPLPSVDATRSLGRAALDGLQLPADRVISGTDLENVIVQHGTLALAADSLGGAEKLLNLTVDYLKTREQFGRLIGSFQALKHRCADHKMALVAGSALLDEANSTPMQGQISTLEFSVAKVGNADAYATLAQDSIQLHGGIGFTWEHVCHLFLKRAKLNQALFGTSAWHLDQIARQLVA